MAVMVLATQGRVQYDAYVFANVGADSENPATLDYLEVFGRPFALRWGLNLVEIGKVRRDGTPETLLERIRRGVRGIVIPARFWNLAGNEARFARQCTADFKIRPIARWTREHGATPSHPATVGLGISTDELGRARTDSGFRYQILEYPLLDLRLSRNDCHQLIADAGLPQPPKSSCWFCPFRRPSGWRQMKHDNPELFAQAVVLERELDERKGRFGLWRVRLTDSVQTLDQVVQGDQMTLDDAMDGCESGYCWT